MNRITLEEAKQYEGTMVFLTLDCELNGKRYKAGEEFYYKPSDTIVIFDESDDK